MSYYTSQKKNPNPFSWLSMDIEQRRIFKGFLAFICISRANESTISTLRPLATPTALLCLALSWGLTTRHSHYKDIREESFFFFSPPVTWEQEPLGASLIGLVTKDWSNPKALVLQKWAEKHRHWWMEWMVRRACYYLTGDHICGMNWEGFVFAVQQLPSFSGDSWDWKSSSLISVTIVASLLSSRYGLHNPVWTQKREKKAVWCFERRR